MKPSEITKRDEVIINTSIHTYKATAIREGKRFINYPEYKAGCLVTPLVEKIVMAIRRADAVVKYKPGYELQAVIIPELAAIDNPDSSKEMYLVSNGMHIVAVCGKA